MNLQTLAEAASFFRSRLGNLAGYTHKGLRDLYTALGYKRELTIIDYRSRYKRDPIANRIVKAFPLGTWRGVELIEDEDPTKLTPFEESFEKFNARLKVWDTLKKADILAGIGRYAVVLIGGPGELESPLEQATLDELAYLTPYAEDDATVEQYETDRRSPRFGLPKFYSVKRTSISDRANNASTVGKRVHHSRVFHVADGLLDDRVYGEPRLQCVWNRLDDLEKVTGGGSEAFWRRADRGVQFDLDPTLDFKDDQKLALRSQVEDFEHGLKRYMLTRGLKINELGSDVADFKSPVESIIGQISAGTGIPQRVLMGSEQGKLAAKQDSANWDNRVTDRQNEYAAPCIVRPFIDRMIELGVLVPPKEDYNIRWSSIRTMDNEQRARIAADWADLNDKMQETVVTPNEIRERVLELPPLDKVISDEVGSQITQPVAAAKKGEAAYKQVHRAADRFRSASNEDHEPRVHEGEEGTQTDRAEEGAREEEREEGL